MKKPISFVEEFNLNNSLIKIYFEENGGSGNSWFRVFSRESAFDPFRMVQNTSENPQEYIIQNSSKVPEQIQKLENKLSKAILRQRKKS